MMMTTTLVSAALCLASTVSLDGTWQFARFPAGQGPEDVAAVSNGSWRAVTVPHDWAIEGPFTPGKDTGCGALPWKADGWYRRTFELTAADAKVLAEGGRAYLTFDGVMARPQAFVNGTRVGGWDYGYLGFTADATAAVRSGGNDLAVFATTRYHGSRWYPGGGIFRSVRLVVRPADHALPGSVCLTTPFVSATSATVRVTWENAKRGRRERTFEVKNPRLWSPEDPYLYAVDVDGETLRYGIRTFAFSADDGFYLNGKRVQLRGVNLHSDLGPLGMAFSRDAMKRQLLAMRDMGVNAIRTSHNAPAPELLDLCDEMGFFVWDECFDRWEWFAGRRCDREPLEDFCIRNLQAFVRRDRNHPSVFVWSIGNEIPPADEQYPHGMTRARCAAFRAAIREIDPTRPVGVGACDLPLIEKGILDDLDITGWNYQRKYARMKERYPAKPVLYSESASAFSSNGHYSNPPAGGRTAWDVAARELDSYDHTAAPWSDMPDPEFWRMENDRFCAGEFVWTGIDYLGEPTPFIKWFEAMKSVPDAELPRSSSFGICDLMCLPKDRFYLYRAHWNPEATTVRLLPHWNWRPEDCARMPGFGKTTDKVPVYLYTNGDEAELFLNGRSLGRRRKQDAAGYPLDMEYPQGEDVRLADVAAGNFRTNSYYRICDRYRLRWTDVPYEPGEIRAVAYRKGVRIGESVVRTAEKPVAVRLTEDPYNPEGADVRFVQVDLADAHGTRDPLATNRVSFAVAGGEILAVGNGDPRGSESFKDVSGHSLYFGRAVAVVKVPRGGKATLTATCGALKPATLVLDGFRPLTDVATPDAVTVEGEGFTNALARAADGSWSGAGVRVTLQADGAVAVSAPKVGLEAVILDWRAPWPKGARMLADVWERSYGDLRWTDVGADERLSPWYFLVTADGRTDGYGVMVQPNALACWKVDAGGRRLRLDLRAGGRPVRLGGRTLAAATVVTRRGLPGESAFAAGRAFCRTMCPVTPPLKEPVYGYNDWYCAYGKNTATNFLADAAYIVECAKGLANRPYVVMDDGWQPNSPPVVKTDSGHGPWDRSGDPFGMDMATFAGKVSALGAKPGLWYRPFRAYDEMPSGWKLKCDPRYVDPTVPGVKARIREDMSRFRDWGYRLIKIDYLTYDICQQWGGDRGRQEDRLIRDTREWRDSSRTTVEVVKDLMRTMREAAGPDVVLIGCNGLNHLVAGLFELQRIGDDTSGREWARTRDMGVNTLGYRAIQDRVFFAADADCVGLCAPGAVPWEKNAQWLDLVSRSGTPLFVSWHRRLATPEFRAALAEAFRRAAVPQPSAEPADWADPGVRHPSRWRFGDIERNYDWN